MRVVSLTCSNTEIVHYLGADHMLVGVDSHSDFPADLVRGLPRVGPDLQIDIDAVRALKPDLVLASLTVPGHEKVVEAVQRAGLPYLAPAPQSVEDVADDIRQIAGALGLESEGDDLATKLDVHLDFPRRSTRTCTTNSGTKAKPSVLVQWWPKPVIAPGSRSWVQGLLQRCGAENSLGSEDVESRPLEDHEVADLNPDIMVLSWCGVEAHKVRPEVVREKPEFRNVGAVKEDRVVCVPEAWLGRPSPRLAWGRWALEEIVSATRDGRDVPEVFRSPVAIAESLDDSGPWPD